MNDKLERELKLHAPEHFSLARLPRELDEYVASPARFHRLHTIYYDTEDLRLTRWGLSLRYRHGEGWTLKIPVPGAGDSLAREEHVFDGSPGAVPDGARDLATAYLRGAPLRAVAELRTLRAIREVRGAGGDDVAEIVEDDVRVVEGPNVVKRFRQIEVELAESADADVLEVLASFLRDEGAGAPDPTPKNVYALGAPAENAELASCRIGRRSSLRDVVRAALSAAVERLVRCDPKLRIGADRDIVHDARVAVRRLRSHLRTFLPVLDRAWACSLRDELEWLGDGFAGARDADVVLERIERRLEGIANIDALAALRVLAPFQEMRNEARARVSTMIREPRYVQLLDRLIDAAANPRFAVDADEAARTAMRPLLAGAWKRLRTCVRKRRRPASNRDLHGIRIKAKHVRYAGEAFAAVAGKPARRFARSVEALQTVLGEQHDAVVVLGRLRELPLDADAAFVAGELAAHEAIAGDGARTQWRGLWRSVRHKRSAWPDIA